MGIKSKEELKSYFTTGAYPNQSNFEDLIDSLGGDPIIYVIKVGRTGGGLPNDPHLHLAYLRLSHIKTLVEDVFSVVIQSNEIEGHTHSITISYDKPTNNFNIDNITSESGHTHTASIVGIELVNFGTINTDPIVYTIKVGSNAGGSNNDPHLHLAHLRLSHITDLVENGVESVTIQSNEIEGHTHSITISYNKPSNSFNIDNITSVSGHTHSASIVGIETAGNLVTLDTDQTITGNKSFDVITILSGEGGSSTIRSYSNEVRNLILPNSSGALALVADIPSTSNFVNVNGNQEISGIKTFNDISNFNDQVLINDFISIDSAGYLNLTTTQIDSQPDNTLVNKKWVEDQNYDNYSSFNLKTGGIQRTTIQSGDDLNFISGNTNILTVGYQAGGVVRYNIDLQNLVTELQAFAQNWANVKSDWLATSGDAQILNQPTIPTDNAQLANGAGYITSADGGNASSLNGVSGSSFLRNDQNGTLNGTLTINKNLIINGGSQAGLLFYRDEEEGSYTNSIWIVPRNGSNTDWDYGSRFGFYETERRWCVDGDFIVDKNVIADNFQLSSDENLKENITPISEKDYINVDWKSFNMKSDDSKSKRYGVVAQELEETNPELVKTDAKGEKSVLYIDLLVAKIAELENRIKELENK